MPPLPNDIRQSELLNQLVLNRTTMEELGRIEVLWMYPQAHRILGFVCKSGFLGRKKLAFKLSQIDAMGENGILTHSQPDETDADRVHQLESLIHCEVWSTAGNKIGRITDCVFDLHSGVVTDYLLVSDRLSELAGSVYRLPPSRITSIGRKRVLVAEISIQAFAAYREGIPQKFSKASNVLKEDYSQVTQELRALAKRAQASTQQTTAQFKTLAEQARERAHLLAEQAKERAQQLNEHLRESAETLVEQAKETGETLVEQLQDRTESLRDDGRHSPRRPTASRDERVDSNRVDDNWLDDDWVDEGFFDDEESVEDSNEAIAEAIEDIMGEIEEVFGNQYPTISPPHPPSPQSEPSSADQTDRFLDDETAWSTDKENFWRSQPTEPWNTEDDEDPWNITELPDEPFDKSFTNEPRVDESLPDEPLTDEFLPDEPRTDEEVIPDSSERSQVPEDQPVPEVSTVVEPEIIKPEILEGNDDEPWV